MTAQAVDPDPMDPDNPMNPPRRTYEDNYGDLPRCTATSKQTKQQCGLPARPGTNVCDHHGARAPQVKRKAALRLAALVDPAVATLAKEMTKAERSSDRQRAANSILDRAGISRTPNLDAAIARDILVEKLIARRDQATAGELAPPDTDVVDAEIIEEEPVHD